MPGVRCDTFTTIRHSFDDDVSDSAITWAVQLYHSHRRLTTCLAHLRTHYPESRVVLINDGDGVDYSALVDRFRCEYVSGEHLMVLSSCHLYVRRLLQAFVTDDARYYIRLDPDAMVHRRFRRLPAFSAMFGTPESMSEGDHAFIGFPFNFQGGCIGFTRDVVVEMLSSALLSELYCVRHCFDTWARCSDMWKTVAANRFSDDFVLSWLAAALGIPMVESVEICSRWRERTVAVDGLYAVTHPHKEW